MPKRTFALDLAGTPPLIVDCSTVDHDAAAVRAVAQRYANQVGHYITLVTGEDESLSPMVSGVAVKFATRADAVRAGFPNAPTGEDDLPPSGDGGKEPSGDGSKKPK